MSTKVDPESWVPRYRQVAQILTKEIEDGTYLPGEKLPSERELAVALGTSVDSVRGGLRVLRARSLVETSQGVGTRVMSSPESAEHPVPPGASIRAPAVAMTCTLCAWITREHDRTRALMREQCSALAVDVYGGSLRHQHINRIEAAGGDRERTGESTGPFSAYRS